MALIGTPPDMSDKLGFGAVGEAGEEEAKDNHFDVSSKQKPDVDRKREQACRGTGVGRELPQHAEL